MDNEFYFTYFQRNIYMSPLKPKHLPKTYNEGDIRCWWHDESLVQEAKWKEGTDAGLRAYVNSLILEGQEVFAVCQILTCGGHIDYETWRDYLMKRVIKVYSSKHLVVRDWPEQTIKWMDIDNP